jgi:hypothetical protein
MAGTIPTSMPPAFGAAYADRQQAAMSNQASMLGSELGAQSSNLGHILGNIKGIAEVSGGALTPNMLVRMYAGAQQDPFNQDGYAQKADNLRLAKSAADIASTNRSGRGGGGGGGGGSIEGPDGGQWYEQTLSDGTVQQRFVKDNEIDSVVYHLRNDGITMKVIPTPPGMGNREVISVPRSTPSNMLTLEQTKDAINRDGAGNAEIRDGKLYVDGEEFNL